MKINYNFLKKYFFYLLLVFILSTKTVNSEIIKKIEIAGNDRLAKETIILFSGLNVNDNINSNDLNNAFKQLYETDYFKDIKISFENGILDIEVKENLLIQRVIINGINFSGN